EAGLATIKEADAKHAVVEAEGQTVRLNAEGPKSAKCTCPAGGVCRHVLLAVIAVNAGATPKEAAGARDEGPTALDEICGLEQAAIQRFAGADWAAAVTLATASPNSPLQVTGRNCAVQIEGTPASVTFLPGVGLKGAAHKGPKTRARVII